MELNGNTKEIVGSLSEFGLTEYEARTYFALRVLGKTTAGNLRRVAGVPQSKVYHAIECLETKGLAEVSPERPKRIRAKPFLRFASDYMAKKRCALDEVEETVGHYREELKRNGRLVRVVV